jgi:tetratricopeptide (TPR) repeat protein
VENRGDERQAIGQEPEYAAIVFRSSNGEIEVKLDLPERKLLLNGVESSENLEPEEFEAVVNLALTRGVRTKAKRIIPNSRSENLPRRLSSILSEVNRKCDGKFNQFFHYSRESIRSGGFKFLGTDPVCMELDVPPAQQPNPENPPPIQIPVEHEDDSSILARRKYQIAGAIVVGISAIALILFAVMQKRPEHPAIQKNVGMPLQGGSVTLEVVLEQPPNSASIYLAKISGRCEDQYQVTHFIAEELKKIQKTHPDMRVTLLGHTVEEGENLKSLLRGLRQQQATTLIFGECVTTTQRAHVDLHFYSLFPQVDLTGRRDVMMTRPLSQMENFDINIELSKSAGEIALVSEGLVLLNIGDFEHAQQTFKDALAESANPANHNAISLLIAKTQLLNHQESAALENLASLAKQKMTTEEHLDLLITRAQIEASMKRFELALLDANAAIKAAHPFESDGGCTPVIPSCQMMAFALIQRGKIMAAKQNLPGAIQDFKASLSIVDNPYTHWQVAEADLYSLAYQDGIDEMTKVVNAIPYEASPYNARGMLEFRRGEFKEALQDINQAISLDRKEPVYLANRAFLEQKLNMREAADRDFEGAAKGMRVDSNLAAALKELCAVMNKQSVNCPN